MTLITLILITATLGLAETSFEVVWRKPLLPDKAGVLRVGEQGITFRVHGDEKTERAWTYTDIQHIDRLSQTEVVIRSYEDSAWKLGRDRRYRFALRGAKFRDELYEHVVSLIDKPATDRIAKLPSDVELEVPVKRLSRVGTSHGTLYVTPDRIVYSSPSPKQSRTWLLDRDVDTVWSSDPYRLEVHAFDGSAGFVRQPRVYRFALKRPLDTGFYRRLKMKLYSLGRERGDLR